LRKRVGRSELDAALTIEAAGRPRDPVLAEEYWPGRLRLIVAPHHPLAGRVAQRRDLEGRTCLLTDHDGAFSDLLKAWVGSTTRPPKLESAGSVDGVKRGVMKSDAIGVLPDYAVADELAGHALAALDLAAPLPHVSLCLTARTAPPAASPLESLIGKIRDALN
jgi:DNA-binding transcriptional LysR family regulator